MDFTAVVATVGLFVDTVGIRHRASRTSVGRTVINVGGDVGDGDGSRDDVCDEEGEEVTDACTPADGLVDDEGRMLVGDGVPCTGSTVGSDVGV